MYNPLNRFLSRIRSINIDIELTSNIPWVYIYKINNKVVTEKYKSEHGFVIGYIPTKPKDKFRFSDTTEIFKLLKKYK